MIIYICNVCGDKVGENDLREHLIEHNPNAAGMDWENIQDVFSLDFEDDE